MLGGKSTTKKKTKIAPSNQIRRQAGEFKYYLREIILYFLNSLFFKIYILNNISKNI